MKKEVVYTDAPFDYDESLTEENIVENFIPSPEFFARARTRSPALNVVKKIKISKTLTARPLVR
jgi:hypothetical protein